MAHAGERAQRRVAVCGAAGVVTPLGVRVEVINPSVPWPRTGRGHLVVSNQVTWLDELALLVAVRALPVANAEIGDRKLVGGLARRLGVVLVQPGRLRSVADGVAQATHRLRRGQSISVQPDGPTSCGVALGRFRPAFFQAAVDAGALVCPVVIRYRVDGEVATTLPCQVRDDTLPRSMARVAAARDLVVEVHLLPALDATTGDRRTLAALAEYAVAEVTEARRPTAACHPDRRAFTTSRPSVTPPAPRRTAELREASPGSGGSSDRTGRDRG
ncbi:lysophospholipid acyltransferase family protein [Blastococcus sp. HT6-30]|uniref:lysophospholipid acyltransferase family protein n=1 Tax=Blastococcus sp. HT6-30 TaxID=3144843 RepID=UPI00321B3EB0